MKTAVISNINDLKHRSLDALRDQQIAYAPRYANDIIEHQVFEYLMEGKRTLIDQKYQACFRLRYLLLNYMPPRTYMAFNRMIHPMIQAFNAGWIKPFMLFINGKFVKWSMIKIVATQESNYLIVSSGDQEWIDNFHHADRIDVIMLPEYINYIEGMNPYSIAVNKAKSIGPMFAFDNEGRYNFDTPIVTIMNESDSLIFTDYTETTPIDAKIIDTATNHKYYPENVLVFDKDKFLYGNPDIKMTSTLLSIDVGTEEPNDITYKVFYCLRANKSAEVISKTSPAYIQPVEQANNAGTMYPEYMQKLVTPFSVKMSRLKDYGTNLAESIENIMAYDPVLFRDAFLANSNMRVEAMSGADVVSKAGAEGLLSLPRRHNMPTNEYLVMLVNGQMYKFAHAIKLYTNRFLIPIHDILDDDIVEFMYFGNVNNSLYNFHVNFGDDTFHNYDSSIFNNNMIIFCHSTNAVDYTYPLDGLQHFPIEYTIETNEDGFIRVLPVDPFFYNKPLKIVYRNQFKHFWYTLSEDNILDNEYAIDLGDRFMYCNDYNKYMVFHNGRRLTSNQFRLTLPVRTGTPFYEFYIYLTIPFERGDVLDVLYLPSLMRDINVENDLPSTGTIAIDKSVLGYPLSNDMYILWINGKKIPNSDMSDIDSTHIKVTVDQKSLKTIGLTKFIEDDDILTPIFQQTPSLWDAITALFTDDDELCAFLGITKEALTDTEPDVYADSIPVASIMWEIIREQFMANPRIDTTGAFAYDYVDVDTSAVEGYDSSNNAILSAMDSNRTDNITEIERPWP